MDFSLQTNTIKSVPEKVLLAISKGDFVYLIFTLDGKEEGVWVQVDDAGEKLTGTVTYDSMLIPNVKKGNMVEFNRENIFHVASLSAANKIIEEYRKEGKIPGFNLSGIEAIAAHIKMWLDVDSPWVKISKKDKKLFVHDLEELLEEKDKAEIKEPIYRLFLSIIFMMVTPQIVRSHLLKKEISEDQKIYLLRLLGKSNEIYKQIIESHYYLLEQLRSFSSSSSVEDIQSEELGWYYENLIEIARDALL